MKVKSILAAALVLVSTVIFANGSDDNKFAVVRTQESGIYKVIVEGKDQVNATISILDKEGKLVYSKDIQGKNGFIQPVNFTGLKAGEYSIQVTNGSNTWSETIQYAGTEKVASIQHVHVLKFEKDGKYLVSIAKTGSEAINISIFDANDELIHTESRKTDGDVAVVYDVKQFSGSSKFVITDKSGYSVVVNK